MANHHTTPAGQLRDAIDASPYSIRGLARKIADRPDVDVQAESVRNRLTKWLADKEQPREAWATILEEELRLPAGTLSRPTFSRAVALASQLVRRIEAGETLPAATLLQVAEETELAGRQAIRFAGRLRREAQTRG